MQSRWASYEVKSTWHSKKQSPSPGAEAIPGHHTLPRESFCSGKVVVAAHPWPEWGGGHYWMQSLRTQSGGFLHLELPEGAKRGQLHPRHLSGKCICCYEIWQFF